jgi:hypothetical protein
MLEQMNHGGMSNEQQSDLMRRMSSSHKEINEGYHLEESIDQLVRKLEMKGKKVQIIESASEADTIEEVEDELE